MSRPVTNIMSIDMEEWFQVTNFERALPPERWEGCQARVDRVVPRLLDLFARYGVKATFFVLGWIARRYPELVRRIHCGGHEIASHGYDHRLLTRMSRVEFRKQLDESRDMLEQITGARVVGYRAPSYSLRAQTQWVIDELIDAGFEFDSSVFPFGRRYSPEVCDSAGPCVLSRGGRRIVEYPLSIVPMFGMRAPIAGGGYFRLLPYCVVRHGIRKLNRAGMPAIMYFHPWEFDPGQPRVRSASALSKFRHYVNIGRNEEKLKRLIRDFRFSSIRAVYWKHDEGKFDTVPQI